MVARAFFSTRAGQPGSDFIWAVPLFVMILFAFAVFYYLNAWIAIFGLILAVTAGLLRAYLAPSEAFLIAIVLAALAVSGLSSLYKQYPEVFEESEPIVSEGRPPITEFGFINNSKPFYRDSMPSSRSWFNLSDINWSARIPHEDQIEKEDFAFLSGDVLIESFDYERSERHGAFAACDARCMKLLELKDVSSVTVSLDRSIFWEGPRALMPGIKPVGQTFRVANAEECQAFWHNRSRNEQPRPENFVQALKRGRDANAMENGCLEEDTIRLESFDHRLNGSEF